jgi:hypothetical protein
MKRPGGGIGFVDVAENADVAFIKCPAGLGQAAIFVSYV